MEEHQDAFTIIKSRWTNALNVLLVPLHLLALLKSAGEESVFTKTRARFWNVSRNLSNIALVRQMKEGLKSSIVDCIKLMMFYYIDISLYLLVGNWFFIRFEPRNWNIKIIFLSWVYPCTGIVVLYLWLEKLKQDFLVRICRLNKCCFWFPKPVWIVSLNGKLDYLFRAVWCGHPPYGLKLDFLPGLASLRQKTQFQSCPKENKSTKKCNQIYDCIEHCKIGNKQKFLVAMQRSWIEGCFKKNKGYWVFSKLW